MLLGFFQRKIPQIKQHTFGTQKLRFKLQKTKHKKHIELEQHLKQKQRIGIHNQVLFLIKPKSVSNLDVYLNAF